MELEIVPSAAIRSQIQPKPAQIVVAIEAPSSAALGTRQQLEWNRAALALMYDLVMVSQATRDSSVVALSLTLQSSPRVLAQMAVHSEYMKKLDL